MSFKIIQQVVLLGISFGLVFLYIQPRLETIRDVEAEVAQYQTAVANATQYNAELSRLVNQINALSQSDIQALERFLPQEIDPVTVARDIETIARQNNVIVSSINVVDTTEEEGQVRNVQREVVDIPQVGEPQRVVFDPRTDLQATDVEVVVIAPYEQFKPFIEALEANAYPIFVTSLELTEPDTEAVGNLLTYTMTVRTFNQVTSF